MYVNEKHWNTGAKVIQYLDILVSECARKYRNHIQLNYMIDPCLVLSGQIGPTTIAHPRGLFSSGPFISGCTVRFIRVFIGPSLEINKSTGTLLHLFDV